tara:strand:- start:24522 stop:26918 length:2397 start_codon:yes stop_codon:yes gene_type:complete
LKKPVGYPYIDDPMMFAFDIISADNTQDLMDKIKNNQISDADLQILARRINQIKGNDAKIKEILEKYKNYPDKDLNVQQIKSNLETLSDMMPKQTGQPSKGNAQEIEKLVKKIKEAFFSDKEALVEKLKELMPSRKDDWGRYPEARDIIAYQERLNAKNEQNMIAFKNNPDENDENVKKLAEYFGSEYKDGVILLKIRKIGEFSEKINPILWKNKNQKNWELKRIQSKDGKSVDEINPDKKEIVEKKKEIKNIYLELKKKYGIQLIFGGKKEALQDIRGKSLEIIYSGIEYKVKPINSASDVQKYIRGYEAVTGTPSQLIPTWISGVSPDKQDYNKVSSQATVGGTNIQFPDIMFLERGSGNKKKLTFNPYGSAILYHSVSNEGWFKTYFNMARKTEFISEERARSLIVNDIVDTLAGKHGRMTSSFKYGIPLRRYALDSKDRAIDFTNEESAKRKVKKKIEGSPTLTQEINDKRNKLRKDTIDRLEQGWTQKEAVAFLDYWKENNLDSEGKLKVHWFSSPISEEELVLEQFESETNMIGNSEYAQIEVAWANEWDEDNNPKEFDPFEYYTPTTIIDELEGSFKRNPAYKESKLKDTTKEKEKEIKELEAALEGKSSAEQKRIRNAIAQKKANIKRFQEMSESKGQIKRDLLPRLRETVNAVDDYPSMVAQLAQTGENALNSIIQEIDTNFNKLAVLSADAAIGFLAILAEYYPKKPDFIGEAYDKIDKNPSQAKEIAEKELGTQVMTTFLTDMKGLIMKSFENQLQHLVNFPTMYDKRHLSNIIKVFTSSDVNLLEV